MSLDLLKNGWEKRKVKPNRFSINFPNLYEGVIGHKSNFYSSILGYIFGMAKKHQTVRKK